MREIKFRGLTIMGEWVYGLLAYTESKRLACGDTGWFISNKGGAPFAYQIRPETRGQYTGLNDKNGKEIYEGDIVKFDWYDNDFAFDYKIDVDNPGEKFGTADVIFQGGEFTFNGQYGQEGCEISSNQVEVIGNIYENPELLNN